ncbi:MAG: Fur family transcriptional regulator [Endomicrobiales bacterium]
MNTNNMELRKSLSSRGVKPTYPRLKILQYLCEAGNHPTADMIYRGIVKEIPTMSKTTVYNTLNTFQEKGIVKAVNITGTEVRFDASTGSHHHFLCEHCGQILDIKLVCPNIAREEINGHLIKELQGYFKGICAPCRGKGKEKGT